MKTEILQHEIEYNWRDGVDRELNEIDIEHIEGLIKEGYNQGELCQYDYEKEKTFYGWWSIE